MPFYEYECSDCKFYTEVMQKISDAPLTKCPSCGKKALKKLVSAPNFRLKGGGWYADGYGSGSSKKSDDGSGSSSKSSESKSTSSTDSSKSTTKSETSTGDSKPSGSAKSGESPSPAA